MAAELLTTDTGALDRDVNALRAGLGQINGEISGLFDALAALNRMWQGPANEAFALQFRGDMENMRELCRTVEELAGCMREASLEYQKCGQRMLDAISAVKL